MARQCPGEVWIDMCEITERARKRNRIPYPSDFIWLGEHQINAREFLRVELRRAVVDIRRWRRTPDGTAQPTGKGFAISVRHLPAIVDLLSAALAEAPAIATNGGTQAPTRGAAL